MGYDRIYKQKQIPKQRLQLYILIPLFRDNDNSLGRTLDNWKSTPLPKVKKSCFFFI